MKKMAWNNGRILRTISDKILKDRACEITGNCKYNGYQRALASMVYEFFNKKKGSGLRLNEVAEELNKSVIKKFKRGKVYARFKDNIWAADLAEMGSLSSKKKNLKYLLCVIDIFTKYAWFKPTKDRKGKTFLNAFIEILNESNHKPNKLWVEQGREFYNELMQEWLDSNDILMFYRHNEGKSVIVERFIKTLKAKSYKNWQLMIANLILVIWMH